MNNLQIYYLDQASRFTGQNPLGKSNNEIQQEVDELRNDPTLREFAEKAFRGSDLSQPGSYDIKLIPNDRFGNVEIWIHPKKSYSAAIVPHNDGRYKRINDLAHDILRGKPQSQNSGGFQGAGVSLPVNQPAPQYQVINGTENQQSQLIQQIFTEINKWGNALLQQSAQHEETTRQANAQRHTEMMAMLTLMQQLRQPPSPACNHQLPVCTHSVFMHPAQPSAVEQNHLVDSEQAKLREQIESLQDSLRGLESSFNILANANERLSENYNQLPEFFQQQGNDFRSGVAELRTTINQLGKENRGLREKLETLTQEFGSLIDRLDERVQHFQILDEERAQLIGYLNRENQAVQQQLSRLEEHYDEVVSMSKQQFETDRNTIQTLSTDKQVLIQGFNDLIAQSAQLLEQHKKRGWAVSTLEGENRALKAQAHQLIESNRQFVDDSKTLLDEQRQIARNLEKQRLALIHNHDQSDAAASKANNNVIERLNAEKQQLKIQYSQIQNKTDDYAVTILFLLKKLENIEPAYKEAITRLRVGAELSKMRDEEMEDLTTQLRRLKQTDEILRAQILESALGLNVDENFQKENEELTSQVQDLQEDLIQAKSTIVEGAKIFQNLLADRLELETRSASAELLKKENEELREILLDIDTVLEEQQIAQGKQAQIELLEKRLLTTQSDLEQSGLGLVELESKNSKLKLRNRLLRKTISQKNRERIDAELTKLSRPEAATQTSPRKAKEMSNAASQTPAKKETVIRSIPPSEREEFAKEKTAYINQISLLEQRIRKLNKDSEDQRLAEMQAKQHFEAVKQLPKPNIFAKNAQSSDEVNVHLPPSSVGEKMVLLKSFSTI
jgi:DNA repair exonuclease SbcCD ATPase subunit